MKTRLRKQFEKFKQETLKRLWILENPPKFKYNDEVYWYNSFRDTSTGICKCIYKSVDSIEQNVWSDKNISFNRLCKVDTGKQLTLTHEHNLHTKEEKDLFVKNREGQLKTI